MQATRQLDKIIAPAVIALGLEYIGCVQQQNTLRIYIDKKNGVTIEDCERASRQIGAVLDVEGLIKGRYKLEVSSPGIERPLFNEKDYVRFIGHKVQVVLKTPFNDRRKFVGNITKVTEDQITLVMDEKTMVTLPIAAVSKANLVWVPDVHK